MIAPLCPSNIIECITHFNNRPPIPFPLNDVNTPVGPNTPLAKALYDAHKPEDVGYMFEETLEKVKKWDLTHLCIYEKREQKLVKI